ncbi:hypothetical protein F0Q45_22120 [Mycobacterium simiae]|uniref:Uncharacterized protein n=1 Tax=Mycobacterium simiae TaxID=1784 RepID=A0A5B1BLL4_MYCSI|nr:hypothetical protein [Mycobacterium simiae]KAA1247799.1 hypothetical protein F0Q45_22120 [Mycobacterium simiae]
MTTTPTTSDPTPSGCQLPDIPLPPGAVYADLWSGTNSDRPYRVINGITRGVEGNSDIQVWAQAIQYADGSLDQGALDRPSVQVEAGCEALSARQARELAAALIIAAGELDGWATR